MIKMSRSKNRGVSQDMVARRNNDDLSGMMSGFGDLHKQLMRGFGGIDDDFFSMMRMDDPAESMFKFSDRT